MPGSGFNLLCGLQPATQLPWAPSRSFCLLLTLETTPVLWTSVLTVEELMWQPTGNMLGQPVCQMRASVNVARASAGRRHMAVRSFL